MQITERESTVSQQDISLLLKKVTILSGIGVKFAEKLAKLGIYTVLDLLLHLPYKYQDRSRVTNIYDLSIDNYAVVQGSIINYKVIFTRTKKRMLTLYLQDKTGTMELKFFQFNNSQLDQFKHWIDNNIIVRCFGEVKYGQQGYCFIHPEYTKLDDNFEHQEVLDNSLRAIYPSTEGISQARWLQLINLALNYLNKLGQDEFEYMPAEIIAEYNLINFCTAIKFIHRPDLDVSIEVLENKQHDAQKRLVFDELVAHQLAMLQIRKSKINYNSPELTNKNYNQKLLELLTFKLTNAQNKVYQEISDDLAKSIPMYRLLQGDVGSGKTIIAALALVQAVGSGYQAALMAPTEILAEQLFDNLNYYFNLLNIKAKLLISRINNKDKKNIKEDLANNNIQVIIGTHALIQKDVEFNNLGLIIIDEQHRFGVEQRLSLWQKSLQNNRAAHQLTMTATPIPRTLAMTIYLDMDYSVIDELPPGRKPIKTVLIPEAKRNVILDRIVDICAQGRQVYWVCTLIEESEQLQCKAAEDTYQYIKEVFENKSNIKIGLVHGRMHSNDKQQVMTSFINNKINILVATTVIEVGVNVPNANLMIIENPERLGLAQLHQLRGRVGRGEYESFCVLLYKNSISKYSSERLDFIRKTQNGFKLAEFDLKTRGAGEFMGKRQTGTWSLKIADLIKDRDLLTYTIKTANYLSKKYPEQANLLVNLWLGENYKLSKA